MKFSKTVAALAFLLIAGSATQAQTEHQRIKQGVKSGELTKHETKTLVKDQKEKKEDIQAAKADGVVTPGEKKEIKKDQKQESKAIYRKKHNDRVRN